MSREVNSKELNSEIHRKFNEENYKSSSDPLAQEYNQDILASDADVQGFLKFFETMLAKMLYKNSDEDLEHLLIHIFDQWANLTKEQQNFITCISFIHNQDDCCLPLPDDLDVHKLKLPTFNELECLVEGFLENYGKHPTNNPASFEMHTDCLNRASKDNTEESIVPDTDNTGDMFVEEHIVIDLRVNLLEAYQASKLLLNLDENALLEE